MSTAEIPQTQSAWIVINRGHPKDVVVLKHDYPIPSKLEDDEVLVKVQAAALNPAGWKLMHYAPNFLVKRPYIAEHDFAGTVIDSNGSSFKNGDAVFGWIPAPLVFKSGQGALAQYIRVPVDHLAAKPSNTDFIQASGLGIAGLTAVQGLQKCSLKADQTVLVNGGTTAVGSIAIQMAKAQGCKVVATCSTPNVEIVKGLGADIVLDYKTTPIIEHLKQNPPDPKFHVIYDAVGTSADLFTYSPAYLAPDGIFVSVGSAGGVVNMLKSYFKKELWHVWLGGTKRKHLLILTIHKQEDLQFVSELVSEGKVKPLVDSTFLFEDVQKAYERIMTGRAKGKVVVKVASEQV